MKGKRTGKSLVKVRPAKLGKLLLDEVRELILTAREQTAQVVNAGLTMLYWQVGDRIRRDILQEKRAEYGEEIVPALSAQLVPEFGRGFGVKNLRRMIQFAEVFPDGGIVAALLRQLGWTHFTMLIPIDDSIAREFYAEMCRVEHWSTRTLRRKIQFDAVRADSAVKKTCQAGRNGTEAVARRRQAHAGPRFSRSLPATSRGD